MFNLILVLYAFFALVYFAIMFPLFQLRRLAADTSNINLIIGVCLDIVVVFLLSLLWPIMSMMAGMMWIFRENLSNEDDL